MSLFIKGMLFFFGLGDPPLKKHVKKMTEMQSLLIG